MPENAERSFRLRLLAQVICTLKPQPHRQTADLAAMAKIVQARPLSIRAITQQEDPFPGSFTECITCADRAFIVFPGPVDETPFVLRRLIDVLFSSAPTSGQPRFVAEARALVLVILALSDRVAHRAGLTYGLEPASTLPSDIVLPDAERFTRYKQAVLLSDADLIQLLATHQANPTFVNELVLAPGDDVPLDIEPSLFLRRPIVKIDGGYIVAAPGMLLPALHRALIRLACAHQAYEPFIAAYGGALWETSCAALAALHQPRVSIELPPLGALPGCFDGLFYLDSDKLTYVLLMPALMDVPQPASDLVWAWPSQQERCQVIEARLQEIVAHLREQPYASGGVLLLVLSQSIAGYGLLQLDVAAAGQPMLLLSVGDLSIISQLEYEQPLVLWQFARAAARIRQSVKVHAFSMLDEFAIYRQSYSYPLTEGPGNGALYAIDSSGSGELRREVLRQRAWHGSPSYAGGTLEVTARYDTPAVPIYAPTAESLARRVAILVECFPLPFWILGPLVYSEEQALLQEQYLRFASLIAYWLWQCCPSLTPLIAAVARTHDQIQVHLHMVSPYLADATSDGPAVETHEDRQAGWLHVRVRKAIETLLNTADNCGEVALMTRVISGLVSLLPDTERVAWIDVEPQTLIRPHAQPAWKKHTLMVSATALPVLDHRHLPPYRAVQEADREELLDDLGVYLLRNCGMQPGPIAADQANQILNGLVEHLYERFEATVATLDPDNLLEGLMLTHEAIVHYWANHSLSRPTYHACWEMVPEMLADFDKGEALDVLTAVASRFVVEYVVARPPHSGRAMSMSLYDQLQAVATLIIEFGAWSDAIRYGIMEITLVLTPAGRLLMGDSRYQRALDAHKDAFRVGRHHRAAARFQRWWEYVDLSAPDSERMEQIDDAAREEFGFSLTAFHRFLVEAANICDELGQGLGSLVYSHFVDQLVSRLNWPLDLVKHMLHALSMSPRGNFLEPEQHNRREVLPWRFNRELSYMRRPFLVREHDGEPEVLWGPRQLWTVQWYFNELLQSGRLHANTKRMKEVLGRFSDEQGRAFNDEVAAVLKERAALHVRSRVDVIRASTGKIRIPEALGDIDVLVAYAATKRIMVIECKDLAMGRMPYEVAQERERLFERRSGKPSAIERHQRRVAWVQDHLDMVLEWLGLERTASWQVEGLIVVDEELLATYLERVPLRILSIEQLRALRW